VGRRPLLVIAGWLGAAVFALSVGLAAISAIGNELTSSSGAPITEAQAQDRLAAAQTAAPPSGPAVSPSTRPSATAGRPRPEGVSTTFPTRAGTVVVTCVGSRVEIVGMSPVQGWAVHERDTGPQADGDAEGEFRSSSDNKDRVKVGARCAAGKPTLDVPNERD
jgi:hypothetical protein